MRSRSPLRLPLLVTVAAVLAVSSTIQAWRLQTLEHDAATITLAAQLFILNGIYWLVPALLAPAIVAITRRYRLGATPWRTALVVHLASAAGFTIIHTLAILVTRALLFPYGGRVQATISWGAYLQRNYLMQLDWMIATYFFLVGLGHAVEYWHEAEERTVNGERLQRQLAEAQLRVLERQLHPHFLFNTLHTVSALMRTDVDAADDIIDRLSDLLRLSLRQRGQEVTVRDELELLRKYLDIEQMRFRDRLAVSVDVAEETLDAMVPHFVLQPIVENAVLHGIAPRARTGRIDIRAFRDGSDLRLEVSDTGDGVPETQLTALNHGIGLGNTRARLEHLYGSSQRLKCENVDGGGFRVSIAVPFRTERRAIEAQVGVGEEVA